MPIGNRYLILFVTMLLVSLSGCKEIEIKNSEFCAVAGILAAGMDCANSLKPDTRSMDLDETIAWLEPSEAVLDSNGKEVVPARGAAICQSSNDFNENKTTLEIACRMLGKKCSYQLQQIIASMDSTIEKASRVKSRTPKGRINLIAD